MRKPAFCVSDQATGLDCLSPKILKLSAGVVAPTLSKIFNHSIKESKLGKRELICMLSFTCNYVVSVQRGFLYLLVLGIGYVILLWHSLGLPYYYFYTFFFLKEPNSSLFIKVDQNTTLLTTG